MCGILFCERRITVQVIRFYLEEASKEWPDRLGFIKPEMMLGNSTNVKNTALARFNTKRQSQIINQFHKRELNLLVATQVVEEGLNVPACNLVIRFDSIITFPSFIQALGRARKPGALCYALIDEKIEDKENGKINDYVVYNKTLADTLEKNAIHVGGEEESNPRVEEDLIPPFNPSGDRDGAVITSIEAVSLVHRYCNALSCDKIATLFPTAWCESKKDANYFKARVLLPIISPIRDIVEGDWMTTKTHAKRSAYLECCKRLWEAEELTENLLPKPRSIENFKCQFLEDLKNEFVEEKKTAKATIGTKKRTQWYRKKEPAAFMKPISSCTPTVYMLKIRMVKFFGEVECRGLYEFDQFGLFYGIVTNANLEGLPKFTLNASYGTFEVSLQQCKIQTITSTEMASLENFQDFLNEFVFDITSSVLTPDPQRSIMIAPLNQDPITKTFNIDWQLILNLSEAVDYFSRPSEQLRINMKFNSHNYQNSILIPWYKDEIKQKLELLCSIGVSDINAQSPFIDPTKARTFEEFFRTKYGVTIIHPTFPMINCKRIGKQTNFLTKKVDDNELRKMKQAKSMLHVSPELVNVHTLPASMYVQGKFLPSILQRIYRLLLANEFRKNVAEHFEWDVNENENYISYSYDARDEDMEKGSKTMEATELNSLTQTNPQCREAEEEKFKLCLIETMNPLTLDLDMLLRSYDCPQKKAKLITSTNCTLPEPPTYKSDVCSDLVDIDEVKSYYFDKETDFSVDHGPSIHAVMEATTLINAQDNINLEKLEIMGDSVLKLIVSLHIYRSFPRWDEGKMTQLRMYLICNLP